MFASPMYKVHSKLYFHFTIFVAVETVGFHRVSSKVLRKREEVTSDFWAVEMLTFILGEGSF